MLGSEALDILVNYNFTNFLDIGCGSGNAYNRIKKTGRQATAVDITPLFEDAIKGDYLETNFTSRFDCIWASHVLEHQPNVHLFLKKIYNDLDNGGVLCITVPPMKHNIVRGHLTLWNPGLLLYNLLHAGFDCRSIRIKRYGYNISAILEKNPIPMGIQNFDRLAEYAPPFFENNFNGNFIEYNWPKSLFVHIPKTAGNAVCKSVSGTMTTKHRSIHQFAENTLPTFTVVRNPYDRLVSAYFYIKNIQKTDMYYNSPAVTESARIISGCDTFREFVLNLETYKDTVFGLRPQHEHVCDESGKILVDTVIRHESLESGLSEFCKQHDIVMNPLEKINISRRNRDWQDYYDDQTKKVVQRVYQGDFDVFGY